MISFLEKYPELAQQWSSENVELSSEYSPHSAHVVLWECTKGHAWKKSIAERVRFQSCPSCAQLERSGVTPGVDDVATLYPELVEIYSSKNTFELSILARNSRIRAFWTDTDEKISVEKRVRMCDLERGGVSESSGRNTSKKILPVEEWLISTHPEIDAMCLDDTTNITKWGRTELSWKCSEGHTWKDPARNLVKRKGRCNICSGLVLFEGVNDIGTTHPELYREMQDKELGKKLTSSSGLRISWRCSFGHEWDALIANRVSGNGCPYCSGRYVFAGFNDLATFAPEVQEFWSDKNKFSAQEITYGNDNKIILHCSKCAKEFITHPYQIKRSKRKNVCLFLCRECNPVGSSILEKSVCEYVKNILPEDTEVIVGNRKILLGKELDIYIPSKNIAIEVNGVYWHSEKFKKENGEHYDKWKNCHEAGIQLVTIWEDDWIDRNSIVKRMLENKLGVSRDRKINARQTTAQLIPHYVAKDFLNTNHIQGYVNSGIHIALKDRADNVVAVMSFSLQKNVANLTRYATSDNVRGGFTKLLKHSITSFLPKNVEKIITFAAHDISDGGLYENNGFIADKFLAPDYSYVVNGIREHKFNYRKQRFEKDENLFYVEGLTEKELAERNELDRIWDCGKTRYVLFVEK